jgi:hypothetical protein
LARDVKDIITFSTIRFNDDALRIKIINTNDDDFLFISKSIDSDPKIIDVKLVDDDFVKKAVLG